MALGHHEPVNEAGHGAHGEPKLLRQAGRACFRPMAAMLRIERSFARRTASYAPCWLRIFPAARSPRVVAYNWNAGRRLCMEEAVPRQGCVSRRGAGVRRCQFHRGPVSGAPAGRLPTRSPAATRRRRSRWSRRSSSRRGSRGRRRTGRAPPARRTCRSVRSPSE